MCGRVLNRLQRSGSLQYTLCKPRVKCFFSCREPPRTVSSTSWAASRLRHTFSLTRGHGGMKICSWPPPLILETRSVPIPMPCPFSQSNSQIHVDRYKDCVYSHLSHKELSRIITQDMSSTRFHACERFDRCEEVERLGKSVVYVNPVSMGSKDWDQYLDATREKLKYGEEVTSLVRCSASCLVVLSHCSGLALPFMETLALFGTASVRDALQTAQDHPKHPGPRPVKY